MVKTLASIVVLAFFLVVPPACGPIQWVAEPTATPVAEPVIVVQPTSTPQMPEIQPSPVDVPEIPATAVPEITATPGGVTQAQPTMGLRLNNR